MGLQARSQSREGGREEDREVGRGREDGEEERLNAESKQAGSWQAQAARERQSFMLQGRTLSAKHGGGQMGVVLRGNRTFPI